MELKAEALKLPGLTRKLGKWGYPVVPVPTQGVQHHCYEEEYEGAEPVYLEDPVISINNCIFFNSLTQQISLLINISS